MRRVLDEAAMLGKSAETLEELYGNGVGAHANELAYHFGEAASVTGVGKLVRYSLLAGELALSGYAWEEAKLHFERGARARGVPADGTDAAQERSEVLLARALARLENWGEAAEPLRELARYAVRRDR